MTIYSGQLLALLLMNGFNMPTTSLYRNCNITCAEFSKTIFADFLEMDHCFGSAGWIVLCVILEDLWHFCHFRKCGNIARKTAFCPPTHFLNKIWRPNEQKFYEGSGLVTPSTPGLGRNRVIDLLIVL